jgi:site-specific DNA-adenine methylase
MKNSNLFFRYFGAKNSIIKKYPLPLYDMIIEPFAGSASYSCQYYYKKIKLYDIDPKIYALWMYLINVSESEFKKLPLVFDTIEDLDLCDGAKYLIGFWLNNGTTQPSKKLSAWGRSGIRPNSYWGEFVKNRILKNLKLIRHWEVYNSSYIYSIQDRATYFIDPPYEIKGQAYKYHDINYKRLGDWCKSLKGQIIVCENTGATWLPFQPFCDAPSLKGKKTGKSAEAVYIHEV